jgi:aspartate/tyrosine/aromatic aminotransferase
MFVTHVSLPLPLSRTLCAGCRFLPQAERSNLGKFNKEYLPIDGLADYNKVTRELILGKDSTAIKENRVVTAQALSGTGALRVGSEFIEKFMPGATFWMSNPTWGNHKNVSKTLRQNHTLHAEPTRP